MTCETLRPKTLGVWVDDHPKRVCKPQYWEWIAGLGIDEASVMIDTARRGWDTFWTLDECEKAGAFARAAGVRIGLIVWPDPVRSVISAMETDLIRRIEAMEAEELEDDLEWNWRTSRVTRSSLPVVPGKTPLDVAGDLLVESRMRIKEKTGVKWAVSTFTAHTENGRSADVAPHADRLCVQAYSVRERKRHDGSPWLIGVNHALGPKRMADTTLSRTALVPGVLEGKIEIVCGLAAYDQRGFPGLEPDEAMEQALESALSWRDGTVRVNGVRYWSTKNLRIHSYAEEFIRRVGRS